MVADPLRSDIHQHHASPGRRGLCAQPSNTRRALVATLFLGLVLLLAGCGDSGGDDGDPSVAARAEADAATDGDGSESLSVDGEDAADDEDADDEAVDEESDEDGFGLGDEDDFGGIGAAIDLSAETCAAYRTLFDDEIVRGRIVLRSEDLQGAAQARRQAAIDQLRRDLSGVDLFAAEAVRDLERYPFDIDPGANFDVEILNSALDTLREKVDPVCNVAATDARLRANPAGPLCGNFRAVVSLEEERVRLLEMPSGVIAAADRVRGDALISLAASIEGLGRDEMEETLQTLAENPLAAPLSFDTFADSTDESDDGGSDGDADRDEDDDDGDEEPPTAEEVAEEMRVPVQRLREVLAADCL